MERWGHFRSSWKPPISVSHSCTTEFRWLTMPMAQGQKFDSVGTGSGNPQNLKKKEKGAQGS